jgi:hypothetical protein
MCGPACTQAGPAPARDTEWWQELDATTSLAGDWRLTINGFSRFGDATPNPVLTGGGLSTAYSRGAFSYAGGVLYAALRSPANGARLDVELPFAAVTGTVELGGFAVSDRLRIEDVVGVRGDPWRYRNQVGIVRHRRQDPGAAYVFASDEIFMGVDPQRFTRNRLLAGWGVPLRRRAVAEIAYLNQDNAGQRPGRIQGLSVTLKLGF